MQILRYSTAPKDLDKYMADGLEDAHFLEFGKVEALDAHDLTVIDLQDDRLWRNNNASTRSIDGQNDLNSIVEAIGHSKQCRILFLLPQNYNFRFAWGWLGGNRQDYQESIQLKDMISSVTESILRQLTPFPISLTYGKSRTIIAGQFYDADFSFDLSSMPYSSICLKSTAETISSVRLGDRIFATTLNIPSASDLALIIKAMNIFDPEPNELPEWLDEIPYLNEVSLREELEDIETNLSTLKARRSEIENILDSNKQDKAILCTKDTDLEKKVVSMLATLLEVPNDFIDEKEEDFRLTTDSHIIAFEVKGSLKGIQGQHVSKTFNHMQIIQDGLESADPREVKGVLILATEIEKPLNERQTLHPRQVAIAERNNIGILSTEALLRLYEAKQEGRIDKDQLVELFSRVAGEIDISDVISPRK